MISQLKTPSDKNWLLHAVSVVVGLFFLKTPIGIMLAQAAIVAFFVGIQLGVGYIAGLFIVRGSIKLYSYASKRIQNNPFNRSYAREVK